MFFIIFPQIITKLFGQQREIYSSLFAFLNYSDDILRQIFLQIGTMPFGLAFCLFFLFIILPILNSIFMRFVLKTKLSFIVFSGFFASYYIRYFVYFPTLFILNVSIEQLFLEVLSRIIDFFFHTYDFLFFIR